MIKFRILSHSPTISSFLPYNYKLGNLIFTKSILKKKFKCTKIVYWRLFCLLLKCTIINLIKATFRNIKLSLKIFFFRIRIQSQKGFKIEFYLQSTQQIVYWKNIAEILFLQTNLEKLYKGKL
jgi:hypothetical protein